MKRLVLNGFVAALGTAATACGFSLYDTAPIVGVQESQAAQYFMSVSGGYDSNPSGSENGYGNRNGKKGGEFVSASLSTTYADVESVDKLSYSARIGGSYYFGGYNDNRKYQSNSGLGASWSHAFSAQSRYNGALNVSYQPEPGYDNGISSQGLTGDTFTWSTNHGYSEAMDARWSWNAGVSSSGTKYDGNSANQDDRWYVSANLGLSYKESDLRTYTLSSSWRDELRGEGENSRSVFLSLGMQQALDAVSSFNVTCGTQLKTMVGTSNLYPTLNVGYQRRVTDGLSLSAYAAYSDENVDNYSRSYAASYRSCPTWRVGAYGTYVLSPDVSYAFRVQFMRTEYKKSQSSSMPSGCRQTIDPSATLNYNFSPTLQGNITVGYTHYLNERNEKQQYTRWKISTGVSYRF